jgi:N-acylneuraminate cytidylyltransferase
MKNIAIITARGGSKRIPKKNIRDFLGKPIIAYSIKAALKSGIFDEVMVSTDSQEIADIAIKYGAKVPFLRSKKNSDDYSTTANVIEEVLLQYKKINQEYKYFCCLYPTAPFITSEKLVEALELLKNPKTNSVFTITRFSYPIQRGLKIESNNFVKMVWPENINIRSQDLADIYHDCGQFYFLDTKNFLINKKLFTNNAQPIIIPELECQDIDNEEDWKIAELKYKLKYKIN